MNKDNMSRRDFFKFGISAGTAVLGNNLLPGCRKILKSENNKCHYDAKGLQTIILGKTGVRIPRICFGLGSRFCEIVSPEEATKILNYALDNGIYYWDTAWVYQNNKLGIISEERLGETVEKRRDEIFLSTKVTSRNVDEAMRQLETSFKRLRTDRLDQLMIHDVQDTDIETFKQKENLIKLLIRLRDEKVTRFIGFSGHASAEAMKYMAELGVFDTMLIAMNHWRGEKGHKREELAIPAARRQGMGVLLMKSVRPKETVPGITGDDLVRFALSIEEAHALVLGMDSMEIVQRNLNILRNFTPMSNEEKQRIAAYISPFFKNPNLPWMNPTYCDGNWG